MKAQLNFVKDGHPYQREIEIHRLAPEIRVPFAPKDLKAGNAPLGPEPPEFPVIIFRYSHMEGEMAVYAQVKPLGLKTDKA